MNEVFLSVTLTLMTGLAVSASTLFLMHNGGGFADIVQLLT